MTLAEDLSGKKRCPCCNNWRTHLYKHEANPKAKLKICLFCIRGVGGNTVEKKPTKEQKKYFEDKANENF